MIKISETRWVNESEEYISLLTKGSKKKVKAVCPTCGVERLVIWPDVFRNKSTFCISCAALQKTVAMIGKKYGRLTVKSICKTRGKGRDSRVVAVCDCGKTLVVLRKHLESGHTTSCGCYNLEVISGKNSHFYDSSLTDEDRSSFRPNLAKWRKQVFERDNCECVVCGSQDNLVVHHLNGYRTNRHLATDVNNGVAVCRNCHTEFHNIFMGNYRTPVTTEDFEQFKEQF